MGEALPPAEQVKSQAIAHCCVRKCFGRTGQAAGCCKLDTRDYIIGPIQETDKLLEAWSEHLGRPIEYAEAFVDFEEGRRWFPERQNWQRRECYPALRVKLDEPEFPCVFLGEDRLCRIHPVRSATCRNYHCEHLRQLLSLL